MDETSDRFALPLIQPGQAQKELFHNEAILGLETRISPCVETVATDVPPTDPAPGQSWIVGAAPEGLWASHPQAIALWTAAGWRFADPIEGMMAWVRDTANWTWWDGSDWIDDVFPVPGLSVNGVRVVSMQQPGIAAPSGGTTIDTEARTTLSAILMVLENHGLIAA